MAYSDIVATGRGEAVFALQIAQLKTWFTTDNFTPPNLGAEQDSKALLSRASLEYTDGCDLRTGRPKQGGVTFALAEGPGASLTAIFAAKALAIRDYLTVTLSRTGMSITVADGSRLPASNFVVWIGTEAIKISSRTGGVLTVAASGRGFYGTSAKEHKVYASEHSYPLVTDRPIRFRRRRVKLWAYERLRSGAISAGELRWQGQLSGWPKLQDATRWSLPCSGIAERLNWEFYSQHVESPIVGPLYHGVLTIGVRRFIEEAATDSWRDSGYTFTTIAAGVHTLQQLRDELILAARTISTAVDFVTTETAGGRTLCEQRIPVSGTKEWLEFFPSDLVSLLGFTATPRWSPSLGRPSAVTAGLRLTATADSPPAITSFPAGTSDAPVMFVDVVEGGLFAVDDGVGILLDPGDSIAVSTPWTDWQPLRGGRIEAIAGNRLTIRGDVTAYGAPSMFVVRGFPAAEFVVRKRFVVDGDFPNVYVGADANGTGSLVDVALSPEVRPPLERADFEVSVGGLVPTSGSGSTPLDARGFEIDEPTKFGDLLAEDAKLLGFGVAIRNAKIGLFVPLRPWRGQEDLVVVDGTKILPRLPEWAIGSPIVNQVKFEAPNGMRLTVNAQDDQQSDEGNVEAIKIKHEHLKIHESARHRWTALVTEAALRWFGLLGEEKALVTVAVSRTAFNVPVLGSVKIKHWAVPDGRGARNIDTTALVFSRRVHEGTGKGELVLLVDDQKLAGWAPVAKLTEWDNPTKKATFAHLTYGNTGKQDLAYFKDGDKVEFVRFDDAAPTFFSNTIVSRNLGANTAILADAMGALPDPTTNHVNMRYDDYGTAGIQLAQKDEYVWIATWTSRLIAPSSDLGFVYNQ